MPAVKQTPWVFTTLSTSQQGAGSNVIISFSSSTYYLNDLVLIFVETNAAESLALVESGWTQIPNLPASYNSTTKLDGWWKRFTGATFADVHVTSVSDHLMSGTIVVRGALETGNPFHVTAVATGTSANLTWPSVTTTESNCLIINAGCSSTNNAFGNFASGAFVNASLTGVELEQTSGTTLGDDGSIGIISGLKDIAGSIGNTTSTQRTVSDDWIAWTGAILPAADSSTPRLVGPSGNITLSSTNLSSTNLPRGTTSGVEIMRDNDIIMVCIESSIGGSPNVPTGFQYVTGFPMTDTPNSTVLHLMWKRVIMPETYPVNFGTYSDHLRGIIILVRNCKTDGDPFEIIDTEQGSGSTSFTVPGGTVTQDNSLLLYFFGDTLDLTTASNFTAYTNGDLDWLSLYTQTNTNTGNGGGYAILQGFKSTAGTIGTTNLTKAQTTAWNLGILAFQGVVSIPPTVKLRSARASIIVLSEGIVPQIISVRSSIEVSGGDSFLIGADILQSEIADIANGSNGPTMIRSQLKINGTELAHQSFSFQKPTGKIGRVLGVTLQKPDISTVPYGATVEFNLIFTDVLGVDHPYPLLEDGRLQTVEITLKMNARGQLEDSLEISAIDVLYDVFSKAPRYPVIMFDPRKISYADVKVDAEGAIRDVNDNPILPVLEPVQGLTFLKVLERAYTESGGLTWASSLDPSQIARMSPIVQQLLINSSNEQTAIAFDKVITNIQDYTPPTGRADFFGSWHEGAAPFVAPYNPIYKIQNNILSILYIDKPLPSGSVPHLIPLNRHKELRESIPFQPDRNALDITYQENPVDVGILIGVEEKVETTKSEGLSSSSIGYTETTFKETIYFEYLEGERDKHLSEKVMKTVKTVKTRIWNPTVSSIYGGATIFITTSKEVQRNEYFGELKIGHIKTTKAPVYVGSNASPMLTSVIEERYTANWVDNPFVPGSKVLLGSETITKGLVILLDTEEEVAPPVENNDNTSDENTEEGVADATPAEEATDEEVGGSEGQTDGGDEEPEPEEERATIIRRVPILAAQASGIVYAETLRHWAVMEVTTTRLQKIQGNQYDVMITTTDVLSGTVTPPQVETRTGSTVSNVYGVRSKTIRIVDEESVDDIGFRTPESMNALELPKDMALELGYHVLRRFKYPSRNEPIQLVSVDPFIDQGTVFTAERRSGISDGYDTVSFVCTGLGINGTNLGQDGHRIDMSIESLELLAPSGE